MQAENHRTVGLRRAAVRLLVVAALVGIGFLMHRIGREFDVMIDNGAATIDGARYDGMEYGNVAIDAGKGSAFDIWAGDRVIKKMVGAKHKLTIKILNEDDDSVVKTVERDITIDFDTRAEMVSIGAIIAGARNILAKNPLYSPAPVFVPQESPTEPATPEEGSLGEEMGGMAP
jgi:hypothetical protein